MELTVNYGILQGVFAVPNCVVDQHIKLAGAAQLKVLLFLLRHSGEKINLDKIAQHLGYSAADVKDAINYWQEVGVLAQISQSNPVGTADNKTQAAGQDDVKEGKPHSKPADGTKPPQADVPVVREGNITRITTSYRFTQKEAFSRMEKNEDLRFIIDQCRQLLGRELQGSDVVAIVSIHDWAGLPPDVILMAVEYCASRGETSMRSIERQCTMWLDIGIKTHEQADDYIKRQAERHSREALVQGAFGITGRKLSTKEKEAVARWFDDYGFDIALIRLAFDKTVDNTGKLSFAYLDKILANWHSKGIKTIEAAAAESAEKPKRAARTTSLDMQSIENEGIYDTPKL